jgi:acyl-CoA oxidase
MDALNASNHERLQQGDVSLLPALHAASAGLKAHATWRCCEALEEARQSCGGSGYHASAGFSALIADFAVMPTWEGENTVMALQVPLRAFSLARRLDTSAHAARRLQTARFLVKRLSQLSKARAPAAATPLMPKDALVAMYLAPSAPCASFVAADDAEPSTVTLQRLAERAARLATEEAARALETRSAALGDELAAWNASSVELLAAARAHCALLLVVNFVTAVERVCRVPPPAAPLRRPSHTSLASQFAGSEPIKAVLRELARLNALVHIRGCADALLAAGAVSSGFFSRLKAELVASCSKVSPPCTCFGSHPHALNPLAQLRANALPLVDAFALRDSVLRSVIGRADGEVYEHYVARVESSPSRLVDGRPAYWPSLRAFLSRAARQ